MVSEKKELGYVKVNQGYTEIKLGDNICKWEQSRSEKYIEYRKKWYENPKNLIVETFPLHLDIEASKRCNLRCPMCPRTLKLKRGDDLNEGDIDFELVKKLIDEGSENGLYSIKFNFMGEPLLNKDLPKFVKYAKDKGIVDVMINTNGVLLTEEMSARLIEAGLDKIFVSFDSSEKESYEKIRVGANFEDVFQNVKRLAEMKKKLGKITPIIRASMVVMKENESKLLDYIKMWQGIVDLIGFDDYVNPRGMDKDDRSISELKEHDNFICSQLYQRLVINWDGQISLCCNDFNIEMNMGNAKEINIKEVWNGERMKKIRELHESGQYKKVQICKNCEYALL